MLSRHQWHCAKLAWHHWHCAMSGTTDTVLSARHCLHCTLWARHHWHCLVNQEPLTLPCEPGKCQSLGLTSPKASLPGTGTFNSATLDYTKDRLPYTNTTTTTTTYSHIFSYSFSLSLTHTHINMHALMHTRMHAHMHAHTHTHIHTVPTASHGWHWSGPLSLNRWFSQVVKATSYYF